MSTIAGTIILKNNPAINETKSGILLPTSMVDEDNIGTVIHVGAGNAKNPQEVSPGDTVVYNHKSFRKKEFILHDEDVVRVNFEDIYLIKKK
jgi:co-chaperonin GroES (HSP10)